MNKLSSTLRNMNSGTERDARNVHNFIKYLIAIILLSLISSCGEKKRSSLKLHVPSINDTFYYFGESHYNIPHIDFDTITFDSAVLIRFHQDSVVFHFNMRQFMNSLHEFDHNMPSIDAFTSYCIHNNKYMNEYKYDILLASDEISFITDSTILFLFEKNFLKKNITQKMEFQGKRYR